MPTPIANIGQIAINTRDLPQAVAYFRDPDRNLLALMREVRPETL